jgi:hypothetical protein
MKRILEGLNILSKYFESGDFNAEHDQIWAGGDYADDADMAEEDIKKLKDLGWFIDEEFNCWSHFC